MFTILIGILFEMFNKFMSLKLYYKLLISLNIFLISCEKDFKCSCEITNTIDDIYYENKIETKKSTSSIFENYIIHGKKNDAKSKCNADYSINKKNNTDLLEGRNGGEITIERICNIIN
jgi:hypothetical protein